MKVPSRITDQLATLKRVVAILTGQVDFYDNIKCRIVDVADTGTAGVAFTVTHNLGVVPVAYIANIDRSGIVYDSSRATWTDTEMTLKCSVNNAALKLIVF